jgi:hypothetical protein
MDYIHDHPPAIQDRLPDGPALTDWLITELDRAHASAVRLHVPEDGATHRGLEDAWLMLRALVLRHRPGPTYVTNRLHPTEPDVQDGWHCLECGLGRDGPTDEWPCEMLVMVATLLWCVQGPNVPVAWGWAASEDRLVWSREVPGGNRPTSSIP